MTVLGFFFVVFFGGLNCRAFLDLKSLRTFLVALSCSDFKAFNCLAVGVGTGDSAAPVEAEDGDFGST